MTREYQFSLRQLLIVTTLVAVCLGVGKWCYIKYDDRIHVVTTDFELQLYRGKRVSLCGRYQYVGDASSFQVVWFANHHQIPIAVMGACGDGSPLLQIPDGAMITVTGRLMPPPKDGMFPFPAVRRDPYSGYLVYDEASVVQHEAPFTSVWHSITAEEVSVVTDFGNR